MGNGVAFSTPTIQAQAEDVIGKREGRNNPEGSSGETGGARHEGQGIRIEAPILMVRQAKDKIFDTQLDGLLESLTAMAERSGALKQHADTSTKLARARELLSSLEDIDGSGRLEKQALIDLKKYILEGSRFPTDHWDHGWSIHEFGCVAMDSTSTHILRLDLSFSLLFTRLEDITANIACCIALQTLDLSQNFGLSGDLRAFDGDQGYHLPNRLRDLDLSETSIGGRLDSLGGLPRLENIAVAQTSIEGDIAGLKEIENFSSLRKIDLTGTYIGGDIAGIHGCEHVIRVGLQDTNVFGSFESWEHMRQIRILNVRNTLISGSTLNLKGLSRKTLVVLDARNSNLHGDIGELSGLVNLSVLYLDRTMVSGNIKHLSTLTDLEDLTLYSTRVTGPLSSLSPCTNLREINLHHTLVGDDTGLRGLETLTRLKTLDVSACPNLSGKIPTELSDRGLNDHLELTTIGTTGLRSELKNVSISTAQYPFHVISTEALRKLDRLCPHEQAKADGILFFTESVILEFEAFKFGGGEFPLAAHRDEIAFISHRWLSNTANNGHPDDETNSKLKHIQRLSYHYPIKFWWIDFLSVPQEDPGLLMTAIFSLPHYCKCCGHFFVVVDDEHPNDRASFSSWELGGWCRLERLAAMAPCLSGSDGTTPWISQATGHRLRLEKINPRDFNPLEGQFWDDHQDDIQPADKDRTKIEKVVDEVYQLFDGKAGGVFSDI